MAAASGGAGGPFGDRWDFDLDGELDSTEEDPVHVYTRPYAGNVKMRVRDAASALVASPRSSWEASGSAIPRTPTISS